MIIMLIFYRNAIMFIFMLSQIPELIAFVNFSQTKINFQLSFKPGET